MTFTWGMRLPKSRIDSLGKIRLAAGVRVLECPAVVWIAGEMCDDALALELASLPQGQRFIVLPDGQLLAPGHRVPQGELPTGDWRPLAEWLRVELPTAALAATRPSRMTLKLMRGGGEQLANVLATSGSAWLDYAQVAPQVRLKHWAFAVDVRQGESQVIVRGAPLPPIPGNLFVEQHGVACPAGFTLDPPIENSVIAASLKLSAGDLVLLHVDGSYELIAAQQFAQATRSAVRLSLASLGFEAGA